MGQLAVVRISLSHCYLRHLSLVRNAFSGIPTFVKEVVTPAEVKAALDSSDILSVLFFSLQRYFELIFRIRNEIPEMIACIEPIESGFILTDPTDLRHQYITGLKQRFGQLLHKASVSLRLHGEENILDAVHMLVSCVLEIFAKFSSSKRSAPYVPTCWTMVSAGIGMSYMFLLNARALTLVSSYNSQLEVYHSEISLAQRHAVQKVWPRAVLVRRAR